MPPPPFAPTGDEAEIGPTHPSQPRETIMPFQRPDPNDARRRPSLLAATICALGSLGACSEAPPTDDADAPAAAAEAPAPAVTIIEPVHGAEVEGPDVTVRMTSSGVRIVAAGDTTPGTGHHHVYLNQDLGDPTVPVPVVPNEIVHLGTGDSEIVLEGVAPGEHRLIAVVANGLHVPLQPWVVDTVHFTVR